MITVDNFSFAGKKALIRVDFNVPLNAQFEITDTTRIDEALPTLRKILADGGSVILMSHLGRPKEGPEEKFSLKHLVPYLSKVLNTSVHFAENCIGEPAEKASADLKPGEVLLLENLRFHKEETKGDESFSEKLARLGDIYVNDAFGTAHRAHASTAIIANYFEGRKCFGYLMAREVENIGKVTDNPGRPFVAVLGGAKVSDKLAIIENLLPKTDVLIIGGGMMFTFIKAQGGSIGSSLCEEEMVETCRNLLADAEAKGVKILLPVDTVINNAFANEGTISTVPSNQIPDGFMGLDIGPESVRLFNETLLNAKTILWNGPMGVFEMSSFENGTREVALGVAEATSAGAFSLVGGGDSVAAVGKYNLKEQVSYVSTGGGAMLEFIEGKELPGIAAING
ncbi:MAG: phosphoglycerate kinase [Flavobacteriales bacterium]|nr:phosphoglycerate kinase [Flavobacteriales bacterium]